MKCKAILLGNTTAQPDQNQANEILENVTIIGSLRYLSNFWRLLEMINWIVELKLKRTKYCVLSEAGANNVNANPNKIIFTIKDTKLWIPVVILSTEDNQNYQNFSAKDLKDRFVRMNKKQKVRIKVQQINIDIVSNKILLELIDYLF